MRRLAYLLAFSLVAMLMALPFAGAQGKTVTVSMEDNFFDQADITVEQGTTVTWVQNGQNGHTTTSYDGLWDSGMMAGGSGATSSYTFDEPGTFEYFCIPHESLGMVGSVTVTASSDDTGAAASSDDTGAAASSDAAALPDTGGPSLLMVAGILLLGGVGGTLIFALRSLKRAM